MSEPHDVLEALLFASDAPVDAALIQEVLELPSAAAARDLVEDLRRRFEAQARVLQIIEAGGGFRLVTRPEVAPWLVKLARSKTKSRLSRPALETLAIIAYRQPVSRPEVDVARGVNSEGVLDNLLERRLVRIAGRKDSAGRPFLYETTREFLVAFGLRDLGDLPKVEGELIVAGEAAAAETAVGDVDAGEPAPADAAGPDQDTAVDEPAAVVGEVGAAIADPAPAERSTARESDAEVGGAGAATDDAMRAEMVPSDPSSAETAEIDTATPHAAVDLAATIDVPGDALAAAEREGADGAAADPALAAATEAAAVAAADVPPAERAETEGLRAATDSRQQDPGPEGTELAPRG